jgi:hypothetical protein
MKPEYSDILYNPTHTGGHSFLYDKPERCWNDPPLVQERQPKVFYFKKWQALHLLNFN